MIGVGGAFRVMRLDDSVTSQKVKPGTIRRISRLAKQYRWSLVLLLTVTALDSVLTVANPLLLGIIVDRGILPHRPVVIMALSLTIAALAVIDALAVYVQSWTAARIGEGLVYNLRTEVFKHVLQQPVAFFARSQTGALVSRLNTDVIGAQQAVIALFAQILSTILTLALVLTTLFLLSWPITAIALVVIPLFILPGKMIGRRLQRLSREEMKLDADLGSMMNERFNVAGAMLAKLYGRQDEESGLFARCAGRVRDIAIVTALYGRMFPILIGLVAALMAALVYGLGGSLAISGQLRIGTLVAMATLITRLYGPINQLTNIQVNFLTALVSFDRVFEVLDLKPLIADRPAALALPTGKMSSGLAPEVEFDQVCFRYPSARDISLASLETIALPMPERTSDEWTLRNISFRVPSGKLTALVGPSGAGKTTIAHLVPRLYDPGSGTVRIGGHDIRDLTLRSVYETVGVVTQDAHLFHDTIRANLLYARPGATERELVDVCKAARIWDLISSLPDGLDTVAGDRGYRLSGGEKQRVALARLLLKAPPVVVLDEATAHLDSESELAIQQALKTALAGRTSLVIAHRLSTIREAEQILVVDAGEIRERGTHDKLLKTGGLYAELHRTQFTRRPASTEKPGRAPRR